MIDPSRTLRRTETGYLITTTFVDTDGRLLVRREPGSSRVEQLPAAGPAAATVAATTVAGLEWRTPRAARGHAWDFEVPGEASVAMLLLAGMPTPALARMLRPVGAGLAAAHRLPGEQRVAPSGVRRLAHWFHTGEGSMEAKKLHRLVTSRIELCKSIAEWLEAFGTATGVCSLGAPGMSTLYPDPGGAGTAMLITDELATAPPEWDLGWLLGELLELANDPRFTDQPCSLEQSPLVGSLLGGYDTICDRQLLARAAILRWLVHLHDYTAFVGWADDVELRLGRIAALAVEPERVLSNPELHPDS